MDYKSQKQLALQEKIKPIAKKIDETWYQLQTPTSDKFVHQIFATSDHPGQLKLNPGANIRYPKGSYLKINDIPMKDINLIRDGIKEEKFTITLGKLNIHYHQTIDKANNSIPVIEYLEIKQETIIDFAILNFLWPVIKNDEFQIFVKKKNSIIASIENGEEKLFKLP